MYMETAQGNRQETLMTHRGHTSSGY